MGEVRGPQDGGLLLSKGGGLRGEQTHPAALTWVPFGPGLWGTTVSAYGVPCVLEDTGLTASTCAGGHVETLEADGPTDTEIQAPDFLVGSWSQ